MSTGKIPALVLTLLLGGLVLGNLVSVVNPRQDDTSHFPSTTTDGHWLLIDQSAMTVVNIIHETLTLQPPLLISANSLIIGQQSNQENQLRGKTLDIYAYLLEHQDNECGIREIQRYFDYSSPNLVTYHLTKLYQMDLVIKTVNNRYQINPDRDPVGQFQHMNTVMGYWITSSTLLAVYSLFLMVIGIILLVFQVASIWWAVIYLPNLAFLGYKLYMLN